MVCLNNKIKIGYESDEKMKAYKKAITFSYDDGVLYDNRLIEIFNKYGIKATFNICIGDRESATKGWRTENGTLVKRNDFSKIENIRIYDGHEVACHTRNHPWINTVDDDTLVEEILGNKRDLEEMFGREVIGMAYPFNFYDDRTIKILSDNRFLYARQGGETHSFDIQSDLLRFHPTCYHLDEALFELADKFLVMKPDTLKIFYIWGHSYELEDVAYWERMEEFCKKISGRDDIFYGTNREVFELQQKVRETEGSD